MAGAVWMIIYDLERTQADEYLRWFDEVHIPEKLARPGYTWAAHYQVTADDNAANSTYVALFGGTDSRVFYNPSPAQIKPSQPPETRRMMACRANSRMLILAEEWSWDGAAGAPADSSNIAAERIQLALFDANDNDENLGAWLVQDYLENPARAGVTRKYLSSTGAVRHVLLHELAPAEDPADAFVAGAANDWSARVSGYLSYPAGLPCLARRVWPAAD